MLRFFEVSCELLKKSLLLVTLTLPLAAVAQEHKTHVYVSATAGSTGIGGEISVQPHPWVTVRAGGSYTPHINVPRSFPVQVGDQVEYDHQYDVNGKPIPTKWDKMADFMEELTGTHPDQFVCLDRHPKMNNFHLIGDLHPLKNKNWHVSAGFHVGNRSFIYGANRLDEAPTLVCVNLYNNIYWHAQNGEPIMVGSKEINLPQSINDMILNYGRMTVPLGAFKNDIYDENGNLLHAAGDRFLLEPDENGEITADCRVNKFRPYLGLGYMGNLSKKSDRWKVGFDAGVLFWGGHPTITLTRTEHSTVIDEKTGKKSQVTNYYDLDLTRDVDLSDDFYNKFPHTRKEVNFIKALKIYPVLELKLCYRLL